MAGIYIHIPFCKQACYYCNFHFSTNLKLKQDMINAICKEMVLQKNYLSTPVETIYLGGGTPSICSKEELEQIFTTLKHNFKIKKTAEVTLEANPDDITEEQLISWKQLGINRLSIGLQSFLNRDLEWMNRAHTKLQSLESLALAKKYFDNITIDLIFGSPYLTKADWKKNIETVLKFNIPHISAYALTVESKTPLNTLINLKKIPDISVNKQAKQFYFLIDLLEENGYEHYEISNFAKPGFRSKHNSSYWQGKHYLGVGPSAHSFNGVSRQWNIAHNNLYLLSLEKNEIPFDKEILTPVNQLNEYIMTALRTIEGIDVNVVAKKFGKTEKTNLLQRAEKFLNSNKLILKSNQLILTKNNRFLADGIAADLFAE